MQRIPQTQAGAVLRARRAKPLGSAARQAGGEGWETLGTQNAAGAGAVQELFGFEESATMTSANRSSKPRSARGQWTVVAAELHSACPPPLSMHYLPHRTGMPQVEVGQARAVGKGRLAGRESHFAVVRRGCLHSVGGARAAEGAVSLPVLAAALGGPAEGSYPPCRESACLVGWRSRPSHALPAGCKAIPADRAVIRLSIASFPAAPRRPQPRCPLRPKA